MASMSATIILQVTTDAHRGLAWKRKWIDSNFLKYGRGIGTGGKLEGDI